MRKFWAAIALVPLLLTGSVLADPPQTQSGSTAQQGTPSTPAAAAQASENPMQLFTSTDGRFSVQFPGAPKQDSQPIDLKNGEKTTLNEFSAEADGGNTSYIVMYNDYAADVIGSDPQALLQRTEGGAVAGKTLLTDAAIDLHGVPGRAYTAEDSDGWHYEVHEYVAGSRFYQLIVTAKKGHPASELEQFMSSFSIL